MQPNARSDKKVVVIKEAGVNAAYNFSIKPVPGWPNPLRNNLKVHECKGIGE